MCACQDVWMERLAVAQMRAGTRHGMEIRNAPDAVLAPEPLFGRLTSGILFC